jgi:hypothetical protein
MDLVARVLGNAFAAISGFHIASLEIRIQSFSSSSDLIMCDSCEIGRLECFQLLSWEIPSLNESPKVFREEALL